MNLTQTLKLAINNLKTNKLLIKPFLISSSFMSMILYVIIALNYNEYILTRHVSLTLIFTFGTFIVIILTMIFIFYASRLIFKNRYKEFGLYNILGLSKKHILKIILIEQFILYTCNLFLTFIGGHIFGKIIFLLLNRLLNDKNVNVGKFPINVNILLTIALILFFAYIIIFLVNMININFSNPTQLFSSGKKIEKEPKIKYIILILGLALLTFGYYKALTVEDVINSTLTFLYASLIVAIATYLLFVSLSIFILKKAKSIKSYYYNPKRFISISRMLYRMKANGIGLASVCIMITGAIIALSCSINISKNINEKNKNILKRDVIVYYSKKQNNLDEMINFIKSDNNNKDILIEESYLIPVIKKENNLFPYESKETKIPFYIVLLNPDYLNYFDKKYDIKENELLFSKNFKLNKEEIIINNKTYKLKQKDDNIKSSFAVEAMEIVPKDRNELENILKYFTTENKTYNSSITISFNLTKKDDKTIQNLKENLEKLKYEYDFKDDLATRNLELNYGFSFIGFLVTIIMFSGVILVTYYKQISEAYEDNKNYQIMKQIGLEENMIKKSTKSQILWLFFLPIIIATIHCLIASKTCSQLLFLFGNTNWHKYILDLIIVVIAVSLIYSIVYILTSKTYYKIVNQKNNSCV